MSKSVKINGRLVEVVTVAELSKKIHRTPSTIREYEKRKILPRSNYRLPSTTSVNGKVILGKRIYTISLVNDLAVIFTQITQGKKIDEDLQLQINAAFAKEKNYLDGKA